MLKKILSALGFLVILIAGTIGGQFGKLIGQFVFAPTTKPSTQQIEAKSIEGFTIAAQQINQQTPIMVDKDTRLDRATVGPGVRLTYHYTFPNYTSRDIDPSWLQASLQPAVKESVCTNEKMKSSLQYGGIYVYAYSSNNGVEIARFEINKTDCNKFISAQTRQATPSLNISSEKQDLTKAPIVTQTNDAIRVEVGEDKVAEIKGNRRIIGKEINESRLSSPSSTYYGRRTSELRTPGTLSDIPGDTNNDGILSGSEQYLRDNH